MTLIDRLLQPHPTERTVATIDYYFDILGDDIPSLRRLKMEKTRNYMPLRPKYYIEIRCAPEEFIHVAHIDGPPNSFCIRRPVEGSERETILMALRELADDMGEYGDLFGVDTDHIHKRLLFSLVIRGDPPDLTHAPEGLFE